jgi:AcrR family transcriptional regulator
MSAQDRRRQLTDIGLDLLKERPIQEVPLDEVADRAGISRTLVFHYFPTKSDFYAAVVEAAGQRLLSGRRAASGDTPRERVRSLIGGYLRLVESSRDVYVRLVRGAAGGDPAVLAILDELRWALVPTWLEAAGMTAEGSGEPDAATRLIVRGWLVGLEEVAMVWDPAQVSQQELVDRLVDSFFAFAGSGADQSEAAIGN